MKAAFWSKVPEAGARVNPKFPDVPGVSITVSSTGANEHSSGVRSHLQRPNAPGQESQTLLGQDCSSQVGKALTGAWPGYWKYLVGDWRMIADIRDELLVIYIVPARHRWKVYR